MNSPSITDWISAISGFVGAVGILVGFLFAKWQINAWRSEARDKRRSEVAEELILAVHNVDDALRSIRSPFDRVPADKANDKTYTYQTRYKRVVDQIETFQKLRQANIRADAVLGNHEVDEAVKSLFDVRSRVIVAIEMLADEVGDLDPSPEGKKLRSELRSDMFGSYGDRDSLGKMQEVAVKTVTEQLSPIARLEKR